MKLPRLLALASALLLIPTAANAQIEKRYGTGGFTITDVTLLGYGCFYHPYSVDLDLGVETTKWDVDVRVLAPNGSVFDFGFFDGTGGGHRTLAGEMFFCSSSEVTGVYTATGKLSTYEGAEDYEATVQTLLPAAFTVAPYVAPPPLPGPVPGPVPVPVPTATPTTAPSPAPVYADVKGSLRKRRIDRGVVLTFTAKRLPNDSIVRDPLTWSIVVDGKVKSFEQDPGTIRKKSLKFAGASGAHQVKVLRNGKAVTKMTLRA